MKINSLLKNKPETDLYLLNLKLTTEVLDKFKNIKYVIMQGSGKRAEGLAMKLNKALLKVDIRFLTPVNLVNTSNFSVYRIGNILSVSHGMGNVSIDALLHAITKVLYYAGNDQVEYIRVGTSGGIGVDPGTVVITQNAYMPNLANYYTTYELDRRIDLPTTFNQPLIERILVAQPDNLHFNVVVGNSIAADDFYLGQCRYDGAMLPRHNSTYRNEYFAKILALNICNFEMESTALSAFCNQAEIPATMVAVTLLNRLNGDQITASAEQLSEYSDRSQLVIINYLLNQGL